MMQERARVVPVSQVRVEATKQDDGERSVAHASMKGEGRAWVVFAFECSVGKEHKLERQR